MNNINNRAVKLLNLCVLALVLTTPAMAKAPRDSWAPNAALVQVGSGDADTASFGVGVLWDNLWQKHIKYGELTLLGDVMIARWEANPDMGRGQHFTQVGVTPTLRWRPPVFAPNWFVELGVGANLIAPRYNSGLKMFGSSFNFGDHLAIGQRLGTSRQHEWSARVEHFSNGGIRQPNPGENFVQLRYAYYFRP